MIVVRQMQAHMDTSHLKLCTASIWLYTIYYSRTRPGRPPKFKNLHFRLDTLDEISDWTFQKYLSELSWMMEIDAICSVRNNIGITDS